MVRQRQIQCMHDFPCMAFVPQNTDGRLHNMYGSRIANCLILSCDHLSIHANRKCLALHCDVFHVSAYSSCVCNRITDNVISSFFCYIF